MCCFSRTVKHVSDTSIFARMGTAGNQVVIYSMKIDAAEDLAMILPVPAKPGTAEDDVRFLDFKPYAYFFANLERGFPVPPSSAPFADPPTRTYAKPPLKVKKVGSFDASFVPAVADFSRLDERFRLPHDTWEKLPDYASHSFVVFKLRAGKSEVHPMAFAYPARDTSVVTFPTVHIHDGEVHTMAEFDHTLYAQTASSDIKSKWRESPQLARQWVNIEGAHGTVRPDQHIYRQQMVGKHRNLDITIPA